MTCRGSTTISITTKTKNRSIISNNRNLAKISLIVRLWLWNKISKIWKRKLRNKRTLITTRTLMFRKQTHTLKSNWKTRMKKFSRCRMNSERLRENMMPSQISINEYLKRIKRWKMNLKNKSRWLIKYNKGFSSWLRKTDN